METRNICIKNLTKSTDEKTSLELEKAIFENFTENEYKDVVYETMYVLDTEKPVKSALISHILSRKMGWTHPDFNEVSFRQKEQDDFTISPFQVEEGVLKCSKCGGCKTFSYSKQTRSADEPMTTFATCITCKNKWTYSG